MKTEINISEIPNLDDSIQDYSDGVEYAKELKEVAEVFKKLANYAEARGMAAHLRVKGDISKAIEIENFMADLYRNFPDWAKW